MRQIVLDTETTGLEPKDGHRIIEIGCVELVSRRLTGNDKRWYINPDREVDPGAVDVHGITNDFLADKPRIAEIIDEFLDYVKGAELVIHNAPFDVGFLNSELETHLKRAERIAEPFCRVLDTLAMARKMHPGQRASLDALCKRYEIDNSQRDYHGALLDAQILAEVYLAMTGGQTALSLDSEKRNRAAGKTARIDRAGLVLPVIAASAQEQSAHDSLLELIRKSAVPVWEEYESGEQQ